MAAIWVDADACPAAIREILFRAAKRTGVQTTFVANHLLRMPTIPSVSFRQVAHGFDVADDEITERCSPGDLVVTADIPLAADVLEKGGQAVSPRGEEFSPNDIKSKLVMRDFMDTMRSSGLVTGGPPSMVASDSKRFAQVLDRWLATAVK